MSKNNFFSVLCGAVAVPCILLGQPNVPSANESVTGDWVIHFQAGKQSVSGNLHLQAKGEQLTGTIETGHTGPGTIQDGKWSSQKLNATCVFAKHENVILEGALKSDGTLAGNYSTEGRTETWHAERKGGTNS
jgi:hypothetical protein